MSDQLAIREDVSIGVYKYVITAAGGTETPPQYRVAVTRQESSNNPETVAEVHFTGMLMHQFVENSAIIDAVVKELKAAIIQN